MARTSSQSNTLREKGFTLVEVVVMIGIFSVLAGVVLGNYRQFITNANFSNASENIVIALREAQVYGVATKRSSVACVAGTSNFTCPYGVHFDLTYPTSITIFVDANGNKVYDAPLEFVRTENFPAGTTISSLNCGLVACSPSMLDVTFRRPNPDAFIANTAFQATLFETATIMLTNGINTSRTTISAGGQISLQ